MFKRPHILMLVRQRTLKNLSGKKQKCELASKRFPESQNGKPLQKIMSMTATRLQFHTYKQIQKIHTTCTCQA